MNEVLMVVEAGQQERERTLESNGEDPSVRQICSSCAIDFKAVEATSTANEA